MRKILALFLYRIADLMNLIGDKFSPKDPEFKSNSFTYDFHSFEGNYGNHNVVVEGHSAAELSAAMLAAASVWSACHPQMMNWYAKEGRYIFDMKYQIHCKAITEKDYQNHPVIGAEFTIGLQHQTGLLRKESELQ